MDLTFGSKLTSIELFSSLCYAETAQNCSIRAVIYGKCTYDGSEDGKLYEASRLYHMVRFMETAAHMDKACFIDLIRHMLEE